MSKKFAIDLLERALKSFVGGFAVVWVASGGPADTAAVKPLAVAGALAGVSAVMSMLSKGFGSGDSASAVNLDKAAPPAAPPVSPSAHLRIDPALASVPAGPAALTQYSRDHQPPPPVPPAPPAASGMFVSDAGSIPKIPAGIAPPSPSYGDPGPVFERQPAASADEAAPEGDPVTVFDPDQTVAYFLGQQS